MLYDERVNFVLYTHYFVQVCTNPHIAILWI